MTPAELITTVILLALAAYALAGIGVAVWLHGGVLARRDASMHGASWLFRIAVTPGLIALWPWMLAAPRGGHLRAEVQPADGARRLRRRHALFIPALSVALPILMGWAMIARSPAEAPPALLGDVAAMRIVQPRAELVAGFDIHTTVLADDAGQHPVVELDVRDDIPLAAPTLYWVTEFSIRRPMRGSEFLGAVPGRGVHRYALPADIVGQRGKFAILSFDDNRQLVPALKTRAARSAIVNGGGG